MFYNYSIINKKKTNKTHFFQKCFKFHSCQRNKTKPEKTEREKKQQPNSKEKHEPRLFATD